MKYLLFFIWIELVIFFATGCSAPREFRGDWMEHLNYKQFDFKPLTIHWQRHHYYSEEELKELWNKIYNRTQGKFTTLTPEQKKIIEDIHKRPYKYQS